MIQHAILNRIIEQLGKLIVRNRGFSSPSIAKGEPKLYDANLTDTEQAIVDGLGGQKLLCLIIGNDRPEDIPGDEMPALLVTLGTYAFSRGVEGAIAQRVDPFSQDRLIGEESDVMPISCKIVLQQALRTELTLATSIPYLVTMITEQLKWALATDKLRSVSVPVVAAQSPAQVTDAEFISGKFIEGENDTEVVYECVFWVHYRFPRVRG